MLMTDHEFCVGLPLFQFSTLTRQSVIEHRVDLIHTLGLNAVEIHFIGVRLGALGGQTPHYPLSSRASKVREILAPFSVSIHSPYEMSITVSGKKQIANTKAHFTHNFRLGDLLGATHFTFHPGSLGHTCRQVQAKTLLQSIMEAAEARGFRCLPAPEVAGKVRGYGDFFQLVDLAAECGTLICWDVAHDFARGGDVTHEEGILRRLDHLEARLDLHGRRLPLHLSGIVANRYGEVRHTPLEQGDGVPWKLVLSVLKEQGWASRISIICESRTSETSWVGEHPSITDAQKILEFLKGPRVDKSYETSTPRLTDFF